MLGYSMRMYVAHTECLLLSIAHACQPLTQACQSGREIIYEVDFDSYFL